ncbi:MAG TPA: cation:proton antiporter [Gammaproteobacteria bacterium]|nr:cation:proton antiporter [Gammaproteobacteria bacterium]
MKIALPAAALPLLLAGAPACAAVGGHHDPIAPVILGVTGILFFALVGRYLARMLGQPSVLGELLIGIAMGNGLYWAGVDLALILREGQAVLTMVADAMGGESWRHAARQDLGAAAAEPVLAVLRGPAGGAYLQIAQTVDIFSRYGVIFLLFLVGLETSLPELRRSGADAIRVALAGVVAPFLLGLVTARLLLPDISLAADLFVAATLAATSIGITARVLADLQQSRSREARVILGAAVIDDVLGLVMLAIVTGIIVTGRVDPLAIGGVVGLSALFFLGVFVASPLFLRLIVRLVRHLDLAEAKLFVSFIFVMALAWFANLMGLATIVGAFAAGLILHEGYFVYWGDRDDEELTIRDLISPLQIVLAPIFFVLMGVQVKLETFLDWQVGLLALGLTAAAMIGKLVAGWAARRGFNRTAIGVAMMPRGEVGLIFASIGKSLGVITDALFSAVVLMVVVTTLVTPMLLKRLLGVRASPALHT